MKYFSEEITLTVRRVEPCWSCNESVTETKKLTRGVIPWDSGIYVVDELRKEIRKEAEAFLKSPVECQACARNGRPA
jgi:hypothetical protein